ncbi:MAG: EAL domain-containing protein [Magnetococcales bacterium]|nr:EAL domain-containing protein [Magnetococcales bacterium]
MNSDMQYNTYTDSPKHEDYLGCIVHDVKGEWIYGNAILNSVFQPIFSLSRYSPVGYEGLLRGLTLDGSTVSPSHLFGEAEIKGELKKLDRCSRALHISNFKSLGLDEGWLFLNLNPRMMDLESISAQPQSPGQFTTQLLQHFNLSAKRVVVELLEKKITNESILKETVTVLRQAGVMVAIDDFGAGHSNFDRIWKFKPDIVKLDRSIIVDAIHNSHARRSLPSLISIIHEAGCLALIEGIETRDQALIAMDANADLVQGYYFSRPLSDPASLSGMVYDQIKGLSRSFRQASEQASLRQLDSLSSFKKEFLKAANALTDIQNLQRDCAGFLKQRLVRRIYILDANGIQVGPNIGIHGPETSNTSRHMTYIASGDGSDWSRRPYFRRAIGKTGQIQITRPYLSLTDRISCVTLSIALPVDGKISVVCADLEWNDTGGVLAEDRSIIMNSSKPAFPM